MISSGVIVYECRRQAGTLGKSCRSQCGHLTACSEECNIMGRTHASTSTGSSLGETESGRQTSSSSWTDSPINGARSSCLYPLSAGEHAHTASCEQILFVLNKTKKERDFEDDTFFYEASGGKRLRPSDECSWPQCKTSDTCACTCTNCIRSHTERDVCRDPAVGTLSPPKKQQCFDRRSIETFHSFGRFTPLIDIPDHSSFGLCSVLNSATQCSCLPDVEDVGQRKLHGAARVKGSHFPKRGLFVDVFGEKFVVSDLHCLASALRNVGGYVTEDKSRTTIIVRGHLPGGSGRGRGRGKTFAPRPVGQSRAHKVGPLPSPGSSASAVIASIPPKVAPVKPVVVTPPSVSISSHAPASVSSSSSSAPPPAAPPLPPPPKHVTASTIAPTPVILRPTTVVKHSTNSTCHPAAKDHLDVRSRVYYARFATDKPGEHIDMIAPWIIHKNRPVICPDALALKWESLRYRPGPRTRLPWPASHARTLRKNLEVYYVPAIEVSPLIDFEKKARMVYEALFTPTPVCSIQMLPNTYVFNCLASRLGKYIRKVLAVPTPFTKNGSAYSPPLADQCANMPYTDHRLQAYGKPGFGVWGLSKYNNSSPYSLARASFNRHNLTDDGRKTWDSCFFTEAAWLFAVENRIIPIGWRYCAPFVHFPTGGVFAYGPAISRLGTDTTVAHNWIKHTEFAARENTSMIFSSQILFSNFLTMVGARSAPPMEAIDGFHFVPSVHAVTNVPSLRLVQSFRTAPGAPHLPARYQVRPDSQYEFDVGSSYEFNMKMAHQSPAFLCHPRLSTTERILSSGLFCLPTSMLKCCFPPPPTATSCATAERVTCISGPHPDPTGTGNAHVDCRPDQSRNHELLHAGCLEQTWLHERFYCGRRVSTTQFTADSTATVTTMCATNALLPFVDPHTRHLVIADEATRALRNTNSPASHATRVITPQQATTLICDVKGKHLAEDLDNVGASGVVQLFH